MNMQRLHLYLPIKLLKAVKKAAKDEGISVSEWMRRILAEVF